MTLIMENISLKQLLVYIIIVLIIPIHISFAEKIKDGLSDNSDFVFNAENKLFKNLDYGFNLLTIGNLDKKKATDLNTSITLKFKKNDEDLFYFSIMNYNNFFDNKTRKFNSKNLSKNYYSFYKRGVLNDLNAFVYGTSFGYLPFENITVSRFMLFFSLYSKFRLSNFGIDFTDRLLFVNIASLNTSKLYANKYIHDSKHKNYSKFKDLLFIIYKLTDHIDFKNGISYTHELGSANMLKDLGYRRKNSGKVFTGFEFSQKYFKAYISTEKSFQSSEYKLKLLLTANY